MINTPIYTVKVDKSITLIPYSKRVTPELIEGNTYYVSFGGNKAHQCKLRRVSNDFGMPTVEIDIPIKSKKPFIDKFGNKSYEAVSAHILYADEIGSTPEQAVLNTMRLLD